MLFAIALMPAGARSAAHANSANGIAELIAPMNASFGHSDVGRCLRAAHANGSRTSAPNVSRTVASGNAPNSGAATRMNRNEAPQIAARITSSTTESQARLEATVAAGVGGVT